MDVRGGEAQRSGVVAGGIPGLVWCLSGSRRRCGEFGCARGLFVRRSSSFCVVMCGLCPWTGFERVSVVLVWRLYEDVFA